MTSQELMTSKSHTSQDHHGDMRSRRSSAKSERRQTPARVDSFLFLSFYFFFKKFQFPFLASLWFLFQSATLTYSWQPTSVACRSASEVAPLLQSSKPRVVHRSRRWRTRRKGRRRRKKKELQVSRERERERETKQTKPGALVNLMWRFLFFSHQSTIASRNPRSRMKTNLRLRYSFPIRPATSGYHSLWTDKTWSLYPWLFASTGTATRELDLRCWDWTRTFPRRIDNRLASNRTGKIRWQNVCSNNCSFALKEKSDGDVDMVRHESSKLKKHNEKSRNLLVERQLQKARGVRTHWKCMHVHCRDRWYGTP